MDSAAVALEQSQLSFLCVPLNRDRVLKVMGKLKGERQSVLKEIQVSKRDRSKEAGVFPETV